MYKRQGIVANKEITYGYSLLVAENVGQTGRYEYNTTQYNRNTETIQWMNRESNMGKPCKGGMA